MTRGLNRLLSTSRSAARLSDDEFHIALSELSPDARSILARLARGQGVTASEAKLLVDGLRRQGATGRAEISLSGAAEMWARAYARAGCLKPEAAAELGDDVITQHDNRPGGQSSLQSWARAYERIGRLKVEED